MKFKCALMCLSQIKLMFLLFPKNYVEGITIDLFQFDFEQGFESMHCFTEFCKMFFFFISM